MRRRNQEHGFQRAARRLGITLKRKKKNISQIFTAAVRHCRDDVVLMLMDSITMATDIPLLLLSIKESPNAECHLSLTQNGILGI